MSAAERPERTATKAELAADRARIEQARLRRNSGKRGYRLDRLTGGNLREIGERLDRLDERADAVTELMHVVLREVGGGDRPGGDRLRLRIVRDD